MSQRKSFTPPTIHPALLENFNTFEVLKPQVCHQTKPLVDLGDSHDVFGPSLPVRPTEKSFDVMDSFQNIFVNPPLAKPQTNPTENKLHFDLIEFGEQADNLNQLTGDIELGNTANDAAAYAETSKIVCNDVDEDPEDLIEEVLAIKASMVATYPEVQTALGNIKVLAPPKISRHFLEDTPREFKAAKSNTQSEDTVDNFQRISSCLKTLTLASATEEENLKQAPEFTILNSLHASESDTTQVRGHVLPTHGNISIDPLFANIKPCSAKHDLHKLCSLKDFLDDVKRKSYNDKPVPNGKYDMLKAPVSPRALSGCLPQKPMVKTKRFDKDKPKNTCDKIDGPTSAEKHAVLPSVLMRLELRKRAIEEESNLKRRLILDTDAMKAPVMDLPVVHSPVVLTDDCNRNRLVAFKTRQILKDISVRTQS